MEIRQLILCLTTRCNLACAYCYNGIGVEGADMSPEVLSRALRLANRGHSPLHVQLTGGEPTLAPTLIIRAVRETRNLSRPVTIGLQTNGTRITGELAAFLLRHRVQVGVSLDGPPAIHERVRGRAADTLRGLTLLENLRVPFRGTTVVSRENIGHLDRVVLTLAGFRSARGLGLDLLVKKGRAAGGRPAPATPPQLREGVAAMMKTLWAVNARRRIPLTLRELERLRRQPSRENGSKGFCHAARGQSLAVHPDGRLFPCGQCLGVEAFAGGDVWSPAPEGLMRLGDVSLFSGACRDCPVDDACPGDCPSRLFHNREGAGDLVCALYRTLWENRTDRADRS